LHEIPSARPPLSVISLAVSSSGSLRLPQTVHRRAERRKNAQRHRFAQTGSATGDDDVLVFENLWIKKFRHRIFPFIFFIIVD
jgi:hypothetical protein